MTEFDATAPPSSLGNEVGDGVPRVIGQPDPPLELGERFGRYIVIDVLGSGAMGLVLSAYDPELDRKVALKLLKAGSGDPMRARERLRREAQALAKLNHPNVVAIYDVGVHSGQVYVAMEFVAGQTVREWMAKRLETQAERSWDEVLPVFEAAARGLAAAHEAGLVHRDFKPDNVMIGDDGRVRVMDFGLVRVDDEDSLESVAEGLVPASASFSDLRLTRTGAYLGTPAYMSPEQFGAGDEITPRSDQFAYCVAMFEAIRGHRPFRGDTIDTLARAVREGRVDQPLGRLDAPAWLREVLARGMDKDPARRFGSMGELLAALERGRSRWQRVVALGGVLGLVLLAGSALGFRHWDEQRRASACEARATAIDEIWNAQTRASLRSGLEATGVAHGTTAADRLIPWLDARADNLRAKQVELCRRETITRDWSPSLVAKASWCLSQNQAQLRALAETLSAADDKTLITMLPVAAKPGNIDDCVDESALLLYPEAPEPERRAELLEVYTESWQIEHLETLGDFDAAHARIAEFGARAEALGWAPLVTTSHLFEAAMLGREGNYDEAVELAERAYVDAASADRWPGAFSAAVELAKLTGELQGKLDEGTLWLDHAEVARLHAGDPQGQRESKRLVVLAGLQYRSGEFEAAKASLGRALELREGSLGADHPDVSWALNNLALLHGATGEPDKGLELLQRALEITKHNYGEDHPRVATKLRNIGGMQLELEDFAGARVTIEDALARDREQLGPRHPKVGTGHHNLAKALLGLDELDAAATALGLAIDIRREALGPEHPELGSSLALECRLFEHQGKGEAARASCTKALEILDAALGSEHPKVTEARERLDALRGVQSPAVIERE